MVDFQQMVQIIAREITADQRFLNTLTGFYMDMKLCANDCEKLLSAKLLIKEMDRVKNEYLSYQGKKQEPVTVASNIHHLWCGGEDGKCALHPGKNAESRSEKSNIRKEVPL